MAEQVDIADYKCGGEGAGEIYDLTLPSAREISREQAIEQERRAGCTPENRPETSVILVCEQGERAVVQLRRPTGSEADVYVETDEGWRLDPDTDTTDVCGPGAPS